MKDLASCRASPTSANRTCRPATGLVCLIRNTLISTGIALAALGGAAATGGEKIVSDWQTLALTAEGITWAWGEGAGGLLGQGTESYHSAPIPIVDLGRRVVDVAVEPGISAAVTEDGTVWTWGDALEGPIDFPAVEWPATLPMPVEGLTEAVAIAAGGGHLLALRKDGSVWAWGFNSNGQLGRATSGEVDTAPTPVAGLEDVTAVEAGTRFSVALKADGTVWAWGQNIDCELGDGTTVDRTQPAPVPGIADVAAISAGAGSVLALKHDGTVWAWGGVYWAGTGQNLCHAVAVPGITDAVGVAASFDYLVLRADGTVLTLSNDSRPEGAPVPYVAPTVKAGLPPIVAVFGGLYNFAVAQDGTVWGWGDNPIALGTGTYSTQPVVTPTPVVGLRGRGRFNLLNPMGRNLPPGVHDLRRTMKAGTTLYDRLEGGDIEGDPLAYHPARLPERGTLEVRPDGVYRYTPPPDMAGSVSFSYFADDGHSRSNFAEVSLAVVDCRLLASLYDGHQCPSGPDSPCNLDGNGHVDGGDQAVFRQACMGQGEGL